MTKSMGIEASSLLSPVYQDYDSSQLRDWIIILSLEYANPYLLGNTTDHYMTSHGS